MAHRLQVTRCAPATKAAAAIPSIFLKESENVSKVHRAIRHHTSAGDALPEGGTSLGRPHRFGARASQELATCILRRAIDEQRPCRWARLAIGARHHHA